MGLMRRGSRVSLQFCCREQPARSRYLAGRQAGGRELASAMRALRRRRGRATIGRAGGPLFHGSRRRRPARPLLRYDIVHVNDARYVTARQITGDQPTDDRVCRVSESLRVRVSRPHVSMVFV